MHYRNTNDTRTREKSFRKSLLLLAAVFSFATSGVIDSAQAETQWSPPDMSASVYYNPDGGKNYHGDQNCRAVKKRYLPLSPLALADLYTAPYDGLTPCPRCSPPYKFGAAPDDGVGIDEGNPGDLGVENPTKAIIIDPVPAYMQYPGAPTLSAKYAILYNLSNGQVLYEKNAGQRCEPASLSKLLAVLTANANGGENIKYTVGSEIDLVGSNSSTAYLRKKNVMSYQAIVDGILLPSGNDAAYTMAVNVARHVNGKNLTDEEALNVFAGLMNETANALGCADSHFISVDGYPSKDHYSTAYDMLRIAIAAANTPVIAKSAAKSQAYHVFLSKREVVWETTNLLLRKDSGYYYECATGMKTGSTGKGFSLAASAEKDGTCLIAVLIDADHDGMRFQEAIALFEYGFEP